ncbi:flagellar hook capping protein [Cellulomonas sp. JZ18]|uniref:flagellar hook assembly protein FlgD n=1 Tax=Cellulomonas sp. JZ18 TaxID=2654191 RepID=UPI0012D38F30|nr:flagellar hook capping FlgD N-terminal domain-containing protein [Cellulomonas sp. JZ18]QGQ20301.1 flagellar hook capping protein [Cellulomonas sp. JZ18]
MSIDVSYLTGPRTPDPSGTGASAASNGELDKQAFLELLVTQLRYQDPSSPMDASALMAQTTQLTTMERLVELSDTQREAFALQMRQSAAGLVGHDVTWTDADGTTRSGRVASVSYAGTVPTVRVGDVDVPLDAVAAVTAAAPAAAPAAPTTSA